MKKAIRYLLAGLLCAALALTGVSPALAAESAAADKEETVYIRAAADGTPEAVTVECVLRYAGDGEGIRDVSDMLEIKNTQGDEEYRRGDGQALTWEDHGEIIRYEGKTRLSPPVGVKVSFFLDGKAVAPAALAGKSGHVRIRFDYENNSRQTVTLGGGEQERQVETVIPFVAMTVALLPEEVFSGVTVTNARLLELGDATVFVGTAAPGLREALAPEEYRLTEELELPEYAELEADVTDFSLDFTATIFSNGLLEALEREDLEDLWELAGDIDELMDGVHDLAMGAQGLADGGDTLSGGLGSYAGGVSQLRDGLQALSGQLSAIQPGSIPTPDYASLLQALDALAQGADACRAAAVSLSGAAGELSSARDAAAGALDGVSAQVAQAMEGMELSEEQRGQILAAVDAGVGDARGRLQGVSVPDVSGAAAAVSAGAETLLAQLNAAQAAVSQAAGVDSQGLVARLSALTGAVQQLAQAAASLAGASPALQEGAEALAQGARSLSIALWRFHGEGLEELSGLGGDALRELADRLQALREADQAFDTFTGLAEGRTGSVRFIVETAGVG